MEYKCGLVLKNTPLITAIFHKSVPPSAQQYLVNQTKLSSEGLSLPAGYRISHRLCPGSGVKCLSKGSVLLSALTHSLFSAGLLQMALPLPFRLISVFLNMAVKLYVMKPDIWVAARGLTAPPCLSFSAVTALFFPVRGPFSGVYVSSCTASLVPGQSPGLYESCQTQLCQWRVLKAGMRDIEEKAGVLLSHYPSVVCEWGEVAIEIILQKHYKATSRFLEINSGHLHVSF